MAKSEAPTQVSKESDPVGPGALASEGTVVVPQFTDEELEVIMDTPVEAGTVPARPDPPAAPPEEPPPVVAESAHWYDPPHDDGQLKVEVAKTMEFIRGKVLQHLQVEQFADFYDLLDEALLEAQAPAPKE